MKNLFFFISHLLFVHHLFADPLPVFVDPGSAYQPWGSVEGLLQFRGNPQRNWYGTGPIATNYDIAWHYPDEPLCATSDNKVWCGSGWTGQPTVWRNPNGKMEVIVGTYDREVHFIDLETGEALRPSFPTGDIIKGSVTIDPDGYPLLYFGSRDNKYRILSLGGEEAVEIWSLSATQDVPYTIWNNDWDSNGSIINDHLFIGGENGWFYIWKLNRQMRNGIPTVQPEIKVRMQGWNADLLKNIGDRNASIESSVVVFENRAYFTNSGGRIVGLNLENIDENLQAEIIFDYWVGDDIDATPVVDHEGRLYIAIEYERFLDRARQVGQLIKLDPYSPQEPLVWKIDVRSGDYTTSGLWATPALHKGFLYASAHDGRLLVVDVKEGEILEELEIGSHAWSSPVVIEDRLLVATCSPGGFKVYDIHKGDRPVELLTYSLPSAGCIESTPAVWNGDIIVGSRDGYIYKFSAQ